MILFLAEYPNKENIKDGMIQRIQSIDSFFLEDERVYLSTAYLKNIKKQVIKKDNVTVIQCNAFLHIILILRLFLKSKLIYIHSLFNVLSNIIPIIITYGRKYTLDAHGVVPEELLLNNLPIHSKIFEILEKIIFWKANNIICVTGAMQDYYTQKHPGKHNYIIYTIMPSNLDDKEIFYNSAEEKINVIYSGNTQKWQNIELMCQIIKGNLSPNIKYIILTGEIEKMKEIFRKQQVPIDNIEIFSVLPSKLGEYYTNANYGFILRDDIIVNNVACPTKMVEYLYYGITPIVLSEKIGDFLKLNYEHIHYKDFNQNLKAHKSEINVRIAKELKIRNAKINLKEILQ